MFKKYSPDEIEIDGEDYLIMDEDAILAILG
jgi:co-chaperonin GroES (HSP10)